MASMHKLPMVFWIAGVLGAASCGSAPLTTNDAASKMDGGAAGISGGGGSGSGGAGGSSASDGSADASSDDASVEGGSVMEDATTGDGGTLILQAAGGPSGEVTAAVVLNEPGVGEEETCSCPVDAGACRLTSCKGGPIGDPGYGYGNWGPISATVGTTTVLLTYDGFGYPTTGFPSSITLGEGGIMTFHGGNRAGVPAIDVSATIPGLAVITSPVPTTDGGSAVIDTSQDLSVTWVPISIGQIHFQLEGFIAPVSPSGIGEVVISVDCTFEGASGAGVVPHMLLSSLKEMAGTSPTYADLSSELEVTTVVDGLTIVTQSYQNPPTPDHAFDVTLQ